MRENGFPILLEKEKSDNCTYGGGDSLSSNKLTEEVVIRGKEGMFILESLNRPVTSPASLVK